MKILCSLAATITLCTPALAQRMGGTNHDAPTVTQSFTAIRGIDLQIDYLAITWADGQTMERLMDIERGERLRERVNRSAKANPLGTLRADTDISLGGQNVAEGLYSIYFTIGDDLAWTLHAQNEVHDDIALSWKLDLAEVERARHRLTLSLTAGASDRSAELLIGFGSRACTVIADDAKPVAKPVSRPASRPTSKPAKSSTKREP